MDDDLANPDQNDGDANAEIVAIPDEFGAIVLGSDDAIQEFIQQWDSGTDGAQVLNLTQTDIAKIRSAVPTRFSQAQAARYVLGPKLWDLASKPRPGTTVTYHRMTRSASTGQILANPRVAAAATLVPGAGEIVLSLAALEIALNQIAARIDQRLDVIEDKVDEVLQLAYAQRLGDVYGHRRLLKRRLAETSRGATLTDTDWSSIASLGTDLDVGVERLRQHTLQQLSRFSSNDSADERADKLRDAVERNRMCETLQLLLVAQQSLYMWQRLRLERVASTQPDFLAQTIESARTTLREQLDADRELASKLRRTIETYAIIGVTEVHHQLAAPTMTKYREPLTKMVDDFIDIRALQVDGWTGSRHATFRDFLDAASSTATALTRAGRKKLANWIEPGEAGAFEVDMPQAADEEDSERD
jgi:hypothetical protein